MRRDLYMDLMGRWSWILKIPFAVMHSDLRLKPARITALEVSYRLSVLSYSVLITNISR